MKWPVIFLILTFIGPLWVLWNKEFELQADWRTANRASANLAPDPAKAKHAIIQVYTARAFNWRGILSVHTWIAIKPKGAAEYTVLQVIGWRMFRGLNPLSIENDIPDRYWFNQKPTVIFQLEGEKAQIIIPKIIQAASSYPYQHYELWPGPNSNTLPAYIARAVPELGFSLPSNAIGKDFLPLKDFYARAPSGTGFQLSLFGIAGILLAKEEGLEINLFGFVYGISPYQRAIKLPGVGEVKLY